MGVLKYSLAGLAGVLLAGILYSTGKPPKTGSPVGIVPSTSGYADPNYFSIQRKNITALDLNQRFSNFTLDRKLDPTKNDVVANIKDQNLETTLANSCTTQCLYYADNDGNVHKKQDVASVYDSDGHCVGRFKGYGWLLLDNEMEPKMWGRNSIDGSSVSAENMIEYNNCDDN